MIFQSFDGDSNKVLSKIGLLGKSFEQMGESIRQRKSDVEDLMNTMSKHDAEKQAGGMFNYLFGDKSTKDKLYNLDLYKILDESGAENLLAKLKKINIGVNKNKKSWDEYYATLKEGEEWRAKFVQGTDLQKASVEDLIKASQDARTAAIAHNAAIERQTLSAKAGQAALKGLAIAGNMIAAWAITKVISIVVTKIDDLAHASEKCAERADELMKAHKSALDEANSYGEQVEELADKYDKLSKGVDNLGNSVSLTSEEYDEYNNIVNKIADMFPELISGYTNEGNAILSLKGNVEELRGAYKEARQEAYNMLIASGNDSDGNDIIKNWDNLHNTSLLGRALDMYGEDVGKGISIQEAVDQLTALSNMSAEAYRNLKMVSSSGSINEILKLSDIEKSVGYSQYLPKALGLDESVTDEEFQNIKANARALIQTYQAEIKSALKDVQSLANAYLMTNDDYSSLDEQSQVVASKIVNTINEDIVNGFTDKTDVGMYVQSILDMIDDNPSVNNALLGLFTTDFSEISPDDAKAIVDQYIGKINEVLKEDEIILKVRLGFGSTDELATKYQNAIDNAKTKFGTDETDFFKSNSINTQEEIDAWIEIANASSSAASAEARYIKYRKQLRKDEGKDEGLSSIIETQKKSIDSAQSSIKTLDDALEKINTKEFDSASLVNLASEFPELLQYVNSGTDDMFALQNAIDQIKSDKINRLKSELGEAATTADEEAKPAIYALIQLIDSAFPDRSTGILNGLEDAVGDAIELQEAFGIINQAVTSKLPLQDEMITHLISLYPSLEDAIYRTVDGWYLEESAIDILSGKMGDLESSYLDAQKRMTELLSSGVGTRLKMLDIELTGITNMATAYETISNLNQIPRNAVDAEGNPEVDLSDFNSLRETILLQGQMAELLAQLDSLSKSGLSNSKSKSKKTNGDAEKEFDWIEVKITRTEELIEDLQNKINDASGYKLKNPITDTALDVMQSKINILQSSYDAYMKEANAVGLSASYIDKIQSGTMEIETIKDKNISEKVSKYQDLYNSALNVKKEITETNKQFKEMARTKLDNVINDFSNITELLETYSDYEEKLLSLREKQGDTITDDDYMDLIVNQGNIFDLLSQKYDRMSEEFNKLMATGAITAQSDEWYDYTKKLEDVKSAMLDCRDSVEDFKDSILEIRFKPFENFISKLENMNSEISDMSTLLGDDGLLNNGMITDKGLAKLGLYAQQLYNSKQQSAEYANAMDAVNEMYQNGDLTLDEYNERISEYESAQRQAALATKEARDAILQFRYDAIQGEIDDMNELIAKKKEALQAEKELNDYTEQVNDKQKKISSLQNRINALANSTDRRDIATRLQLQQELAEAQKDLADTQADHEYNTIVDGLDKEAEAFEKTKKEELEDLKTNLDKQQQVIDDYLKDVKDNYDVIYDTLSEYSNTYNMEVTDSLTSPWENATNAAQLYADNLSDVVAQINIELDKIKLPGSLAADESSSTKSNWKTYSGGQWQKNDTGWWYDAGSGNYPADQFANINNKTYAFNQDGYMLTGWQEKNGDWYYMEPENGQMVKSTWRQDKNGDWYYLNKSGVMATHASIKAADGNGYYLVDETGKWDGQRVMDPDFDEYPKEYKKGARQIFHEQMAWTQDGGNEIITRPKDGAILTKLEAGDGVLKTGWSDTLFKFASNPTDFLSEQLGNVSSPTIEVPANRGNIEFNSPLMELNVEGGLSNDMARYLNEQLTILKKEIPNIVWKDAKTALRSKGKW